MLEQNRTSGSIPTRPTASHRGEWVAYWRDSGQRWRIEPEIDVERQAYLRQRLSIQPDLEEGIYPFRDVKLDRADVEWLLANHENGRGPVDWRDPLQRGRLQPHLISWSWLLPRRHPPR